MTHEPTLEAACAPGLTSIQRSNLFAEWFRKHPFDVRGLHLCSILDAHAAAAVQGVRRKSLEESLTLSCRDCARRVKVHREDGLGGWYHEFSSLMCRASAIRDLLAKEFPS